jgi:hypothetical protein
VKGLVGPDGKPVASVDLVSCPSCGEGAKSRHVVTFFGGWWKRVCNCGFIYEQGQGIPPVEE